MPLQDYQLLLIIIVLTLLLFASGRFRFDFVAICALMVAVWAGLVPAADAFAGFGHPAVITVAAILVISKALQNSGIVGVLASMLSSGAGSPTRKVAASTGLIALLSSFMNNIGALALMLPVSLRVASANGQSPSRILMPLSFASLLGGLVTLIGTPTNIVISNFRSDFSGEPFSMFDFTPVGLVVAAVGLVYISTVGWRLLPNSKEVTEPADMFHVEEYVSEVRVPADSEVVGKTVRNLEQEGANELTVMAIIRADRRRLAPHGLEKIRGDDILVLQGDPEILTPFVERGKLAATREAPASGSMFGESVRLSEFVVLPNASVVSQSPRKIRMHDRFDVNLLALSRKGQKPVARLENTQFRVGDVILLQGSSDALEHAGQTLGLLELEDREISLPSRRTALFPLLVFGVAIGLVAMGIASASVAFVSAVVVMAVTRVINAREIYRSIDWSIIVLLGALIPLGQALQASGGTEVLAGLFAEASAGYPIWAVLLGLLVISMWFSDIIPNTPVAVFMAPIGIELSQKLGLSADPFLMAVAVGCAVPFLTPIGHQSNTLVMGPGGYSFLDYTRMGIGLELLVAIVAIPMIMLVWVM